VEAGRAFPYHCWNHLAEAAPAFAVFEGWEPRMYAQGGIRPNARQATGNRRPLKTAKDWAVSFVVAHKTKGRASLPRDEVSYHLEIMKLRKAILYVKDLERMKRFYSEILGATPTNRDWTGRMGYLRDGWRAICPACGPWRYREKHRDHVTADPARRRPGQAHLRS